MVVIMKIPLIRIEDILVLDLYIEMNIDCIDTVNSFCDFSDDG